MRVLFASAEQREFASRVSRSLRMCNVLDEPIVDACTLILVGQGDIDDTAKARKIKSEIAKCREDGSENASESNPLLKRRHVIYDVAPDAVSVDDQSDAHHTLLAGASCVWTTSRSRYESLLLSLPVPVTCIYAPVWCMGPSVVVESIHATERIEHATSVVQTTRTCIVDAPVLAKKAARDACISSASVTSTLLSTWPQLHGCPPVYWLNMQRSTKRRAYMCAQMADLGFINGVDSAVINSSERPRYHYMMKALDASDPTDYATLQTILNKDDIRHAKESCAQPGVVALAVGHLRMVKRALDHDTISKEFIFCEDDACWEYVSKWKQPISHYLASLPSGWDIVQLGSQGPRVTNMCEENQNGTLTVPWRIDHYGAYAFCMSRSGAERLIERHWDNASHTWRVILPVSSDDTSLNYAARFTADYAIYNGMYSYTSTIPWITFRGDESTLHANYLVHHVAYLVRVRELYDANNVIFTNNKVSVIIPMFNRADLITTAMESVVKQTYHNWELIVIDDASSDTSVEAVLEFIDRYPTLDIRLIRAKHNGGAYVCMNMGIENSRGGFITRLDSDDVFHLEKLELQISEFEKDPSLDVVEHDVTRDGDRLTPEVSLMCRKYTFNKIGYYDSVRFAADSEFRMRVHRTCNVKKIDRVLYFATSQENSLTTNPKTAIGCTLRQNYVANFKAWHNSTSTLFMPYPMHERPFPAGTSMIS